MLRQLFKNNILFKSTQIFNVNSTQNAAHRMFSSNTGNVIDLRQRNLQNFLENLRQEFYTLRTSAATNEEARARCQQLSSVVDALEQQRALQKNLITKEELTKEKDEDMRQLMEEENAVYTDLLERTECDLMTQLLKLTDADDMYDTLIFEVNAGVGGQEAMLFAKELFYMYTNYFYYNNWEFDVLEEDMTDLGGLRHAVIIVENPEAYNLLRYEGGVHRVQRVPATEKAGRIHTSTASIAVIPRPADVQIKIAEKDLKIETKRASGAGGQHVNTTDSAVRVVHLPTGIAVECQKERSQIKNRETAIKRLQAKLIQQKFENDEEQKETARKAQKGNLNRNEKIRTYNFVQDRITDHRIKDGTVHNLEVFLDGTEHLNNFIERIVIEQRKIKLKEMIENEEKQNMSTVPLKIVEKAKSGSEN